MAHRRGATARVMLTSQQALDRIERHALRLPSTTVPLREALGLASARNVFAREPSPRFDNSAVDGYAVSGRGIHFRVAGEVAAGAWRAAPLASREAVRIFTGAAVPAATYAVVMQEHVRVEDPHIWIPAAVRRGANVRLTGEDFKKGSRLLRAGTVLGPAQLAVLASAGVNRVRVTPRPRVSILATGSELVSAGRLLRGKIRDSNSLLLEALVRESGALARVLPPVGDSPRLLTRAARRALDADVVLISGGVSVGKYDCVRDCLAKLGVREVFWKVNVKPGKPLYFGVHGRTLVFGLPGNPVSAYVTFDVFVRPALGRLARRPGASGTWIEGRLDQNFQNGPREHFVRVRCRAVSGRQGPVVVEPLRTQGSHEIGALASADALWPVPAGAAFAKGTRVRVKSIGG